MAIIIRGLVLVLLSGCIERGATPDMESGGPEDAMIPDAASLPDGRVIEIVEAGMRPDMGLFDTGIRPVTDPCDETLSGDSAWDIALDAQPARHEGSCGGGGSEAVIEFIAPSAGRWLFSTSNAVTGSVDTVLYTRTVCREPSTETRCDDDSGDGVASRLALQLEAGQIIFVFVDVWAGDAGSVRVTAEKILPGGVGDLCDRQHPCAEGLVCFGRDLDDMDDFDDFDDFDEGAGVCTEVRERVEGEQCDPRGQTGLCEDGLVCLRTMGNRREGNCTRPQVVGEGDACDVERSVLICDEGYACAEIGMEGTFCLPIDIQPEDAICDPTDVTRPCVSDLLCVAQPDGAPRCNQVPTECPEDWQLIDLGQAAGLVSDGDHAVNGILTEVCNRERESTASVFQFTAPESGTWIFETGAHSDGLPLTQ